jgi:hypothetical protein
MAIFGSTFRSNEASTRSGDRKSGRLIRSIGLAVATVLALGASTLGAPARAEAASGFSPYWSQRGIHTGALVQGTTYGSISGSCYNMNGSCSWCNPYAYVEKSGGASVDKAEISYSVGFNGIALSASGSVGAGGISVGASGSPINKTCSMQQPLQSATGKSIVTVSTPGVVCSSRGYIVWLGSATVFGQLRIGGVDWVGPQLSLH